MTKAASTWQLINSITVSITTGPKLLEKVLQNPLIRSKDCDLGLLIIALLYRYPSNWHLIALHHMIFHIAWLIDWSSVSPKCMHLNQRTQDWGCPCILGAEHAVFWVYALDIRNVNMKCLHPQSFHRALCSCPTAEAKQVWAWLARGWETSREKLVVQRWECCRRRSLSAPSNCHLVVPWFSWQNNTNSPPPPQLMRVENGPVASDGCYTLVEAEVIFPPPSSP